LESLARLEQGESDAGPLFVDLVAVLDGTDAAARIARIMRTVF